MNMHILHNLLPPPLGQYYIIICDPLYYKGVTPGYKNTTFLYIKKLANNFTPSFQHPHGTIMVFCEECSEVLLPGYLITSITNMEYTKFDI